mmetsp:Transcript_6413/g.13893  ORF Transcript_6413/g.13893 Transcript_6413/m.13893 type:complete len:642 (-) Transcript_6413:91-2016(-)
MSCKVSLDESNSETPESHLPRAPSSPSWESNSKSDPNSNLDSRFNSDSRLESHPNSSPNSNPNKFALAKLPPIPRIDSIFEQVGGGYYGADDGGSSPASVVELLSPRSVVEVQTPRHDPDDDDIIDVDAAVHEAELKRAAEAAAATKGDGRSPRYQADPPSEFFFFDDPPIEDSYISATQIETLEREWTTPVLYENATEEQLESAEANSPGGGCVQVIRRPMIIPEEEALHYSSPVRDELQNLGHEVVLEDAAIARPGNSLLCCPGELSSSKQPLLELARREAVPKIAAIVEEKKRRAAEEEEAKKKEKLLELEGQAAKAKAKGKAKARAKAKSGCFGASSAEDYEDETGNNNKNNTKSLALEGRQGPGQGHHGGSSALSKIEAVPEVTDLVISEEKTWKDGVPATFEAKPIDPMEQFPVTWPGESLGEAYLRYCREHVAYLQHTGFPDGQAHYSMARCLSVGAAALRKKPPRPEGHSIGLPPCIEGISDADLAEARLDLAAEQLRSAVVAGFRDHGFASRDSALKALRKRRPAHFQASLRRMRGEPEELATLEAIPTPGQLEIVEVSSKEAAASSSASDESSDEEGSSDSSGSGSSDDDDEDEEAVAEKGKTQSNQELAPPYDFWQAVAASLRRTFGWNW